MSIAQLKAARPVLTEWLVVTVAFAAAAISNLLFGRDTAKAVLICAAAILVAVLAAWIHVAFWAKPKGPKAVSDDIHALCEAVSDLVILWSYVERPANSRDINMLSIRWAVEFEGLYRGRKWGEGDEPEYLDEIELFFDRRHREWLASKTK